MTTTTQTPALPLRSARDIAVSEAFFGIVLNGGATIDVAEPTLPAPKRGYAVSLPDAEWRVPGWRDESIIEIIERYVDAHAGQLADLGVYLGAWVDGDDLYLDCSRIVSEREDATVLGAQYAQLAIFDLARGESIYL